MAAKTKVIGFKDLEKFLKKESAFLKSPEKFYARAGAIGLQDVMFHFREERSPKKKWDKITYRVGKPLQKSGRLKNSITFAYDSKSAVVGTNVVYAAVHNYGYKKRNIKQREYLWISKKAEDKMALALVDLLEKQ